MNAATNPFRSERVTALPFIPQGQSWEGLHGKLEALRFRGAIVGPCGSGKTTLLEALVPHLETRGLNVQMWRLDISTRHLPPSFWQSSFNYQDAILLDGAEQLSWWQWRRVKRQTCHVGAFIITSHRAGLLPTWLTATTSPTLLGDLCFRLGVSLSDEEIEAIYNSHKGNLRECLLELYDSMATFP